jgi:surfeit locus 1 family protein
MSILTKPLFTLNVRGFQFKPGLIPIIVTTLTLCGLLYLGCWQLERAEYKENLENMIAERIKMAPTDLGLIPEDPDQQQYLPVALNGTYDSSRHLLLDNRVFERNVGYNVYTPLKLGQGRAILVDRGWLPLGKSRQALPAIKTENRDYYLEGILLDPPTTNVLGSAIKENYNQWPAVVQSINLKEIEQQIGYKLESKVLVLFEHIQSGFHRQKTPIILNMSSDRHIGYAVTWFLCALVLTILFIAATTKKLPKQLLDD